MVPGSFAEVSFGQSGSLHRAVSCRSVYSMCVCPFCQLSSSSSPSLSSNHGHVMVRILSAATVQLLPAAASVATTNKPHPGDLAAPFPWRLAFLGYFEDCTVSCSDRRERAEGRGSITDWTPLSLHGSRPRKLSWWCVSRVRLRARWGGAGGGQRAVRFLFEGVVEGGGGRWGGRGVVTALLEREKEAGQAVRG